MACNKMRPQFLQPIKYLEVFKAAFKMSETTASEAQRSGLGLPYGKLLKIHVRSACFSLTPEILLSFV